MFSSFCEFLLQSRSTSQKAASFFSSAVPPLCSRMISLFVEHLACTAPMHLCTSSRLSPHNGRREPADLLATQLDVHDNGGGWLHYQASKFNSRRRPTPGYFVIECSAVTTPHWPMTKLEAGRCRKRLLKAPMRQGTWLQGCKDEPNTPASVFGLPFAARLSMQCDGAVDA